MEKLKTPDFTDFRWSFSKLSAYETCPRMFYLNYIAKKPDMDNAFGMYGTVCHDVLERWARGELLDFELEDAYEKLYDEKMTLPFPPFPRGMGGKYFTAGKEYFAGFEGFGDEYEILSAEEKFETIIGGYRFSGICDLVLRHKVTGDIIVIDHKSKSMNSMKKELATYKKQLYIYAIYVKEQFGVYPKLLRFNMFKDGVFIDEEFSEEKLQDVKDWIASCIEKIMQDTTWQYTPSQYFCDHICGMAPYCPHMSQIS